MNSSPRYLIDSNVFIDAKNRYYAFPVCPGFWDSIIVHHQLGSVYSIDRIKEELMRGNDELTEWVQSQLPSMFFLPTSEQVTQQSYSTIITWVNNNSQFHDSAKAKFITEADGWLAAYAKVHGYILVTGERYSPTVKNKVPLPNVCEQFDIPYQDTFQMLRELRIQFVLDQQN